MCTLDKKIKKGTLWVVFFFIAGQIVRLAGNLVATRLLTPDMFGLMAVIFVFIQGLTMFSDMGIWAFIVRHKNGLNEEYLNTAWSIQVIRGWLIFFIVSCLAALLFSYTNSGAEIAGAYGHPMLPILIVIVGVTAIINAYASMAPAIVSREILRGRLESIDLFSQILGVTTMLAWAFISPTIWALVIAPIVSSLTKTISLNTVFHHRHKFSINKNAFYEIINFGKWVVVSSIFRFIGSQGDKLILAALLATADLGIYSIAFFLASALGMLMNSISSKIFFPLFSHIGIQDIDKLRQVYYNARLKMDFVAGSASGFLMATGVFWVGILYDARYHEAGWMLQILSVSLIFNTITTQGLNCLTSIGITKTSAITDAIRTVVTIIGIPVMFYYFGLEGAVWVVALNACLGIPLIYQRLQNEKLLVLNKEFFSIPFAMLGYYFGRFVIM